MNITNFSFLRSLPTRRNQNRCEAIRAAVFLNVAVTALFVVMLILNAISY